MFVTAEADAGKSVSTLSHGLAAIRLMHLGNGHSSLNNTQPVIEVMRGVRNSRKKVGELPNRKAAAVDTTIKRMVDSLDPKTRRGIRDRALLLYGFAGALRRSELPDKSTYCASKSAIKQLITITGSFFQFLQLEEYIVVKPVRKTFAKNNETLENTLQPITPTQWDRS